MKYLKSVEPKNPGAGPRYGAEYTIRQAWWKFDNQVIQLRDVEPLRHLVYSAATSSGELVFEYLVSEREDGRVAVQMSMRTSGAYAIVLGFVSGGSWERTLVQEAQQLRDYCEAKSPQDVLNRGS